jgi:xanthine dehydrogenase accessory factor
MPGHRAYIDRLGELAQTGRPFVAVTLVGIRGSAPQETGSKMLVDASGLVWGTVGGGRIEQAAIAHAVSMLGRDKTWRSTELVQWNLQTDIGMTCGGVVQLLFEAVNHRVWNIVIFGAGHVSAAVIECLKSIDCHVQCFDPREQWLDRIPDRPQLTKTRSTDLAACIDQLHHDSFVLLMTMGHRTDRPVLQRILERDVDYPFLGVIGSRAKRAALKRELIESGLDAARADQFVCPIGLKLGGNTPAEIAVSVVAQLLQCRDQREPMSATATKKERAQGG